MQKISTWFRFYKVPYEHPKNPMFSFRVDFFIPGVAVVGGFSICSSPGLLEREGELELAVKRTTHPPAHWVHTQVCEI